MITEYKNILEGKKKKRKKETYKLLAVLFEKQQQKTNFIFNALIKNQCIHLKKIIQKPYYSDRERDWRN